MAASVAMCLVFLALLAPVARAATTMGGSFGGKTGGYAVAAVASVGSGTGDPILTGFDGRAFEFIGEVGGTYSVISELEHQVSMKLKLGEMWDHNGTYIDGMGFQYRDHQITVELAEEEEALEVTLDGKRLTMAQSENEQEHVMAIDGSGELMLLWQLHRPDLGQAVEINTDLVSLVVFLTPAGTRDEGGKLQPAYLNFDATLLKAPTGSLKGIVGDGYERLLNGEALPNDFKFYGEEADYQMQHYFAIEHKNISFGLVPVAASAASQRRRRLIERPAVTFPLRSHGRAIKA